MATRNASQETIQAIAGPLPELFGGAADLSESNLTIVKGGGDFGPDEAGRNLWFGVREHGMGGALNGIAYHGGFIPYGGTFLTFSDYMRGSVRLAALSDLHVVRDDDRKVRFLASLPPSDVTVVTGDFLAEPEAVERALAGHSPSYRSLDTAVLEKLVLEDALGLTEDDISHQRGLAYARDLGQARELLESGDYELAFLLRPTPIEQVEAVAEAGETMPPKSTYFYPKLLSGLLFNPLD